MKPQKLPKEEKIDIRIAREEKELINKAASIQSKSISGFVLETSIERAQEILSNQTEFHFDENRFRSFVEELNSEPQIIPEIQKIMKKESLFGKEIHIKKSC